MGLHPEGAFPWSALATCQLEYLKADNKSAAEICSFVFCISKCARMEFCFEAAGIRTPNLLIRSQVHYPVMLRVIIGTFFGH
jgi:hypothetical protein